MLRFKDTTTLPTVGLSGFEPPMNEIAAAMQDAVHRFSKEVLRPAGQALDKMTAQEVVVPGSLYWQTIEQAQQIGLMDGGLQGDDVYSAALVEAVVAEELGWGDSGLAISILAGSLPSMMAQALGNQELIDLTRGKVGCWIITQPDKGSDIQILYPERELPPGTPGNRGNLWGRLDGDEIVINGQSAAWVSNGAVAQTAMAYIGADYGDGLLDAKGKPNGMAVILPLDLRGVSKGKPLDKIGQRALPQGEIYFDNVRIPKRFAVALRDGYEANLTSTWSTAGTLMASVFTGAARSAFELALAYCHERKQGGGLLINHQLTRWRLGDMLRRIELCRATARRTIQYAAQAPQTHPYVTAMSKVTVTEEAMKVATEALQLFGGAGTSREFPIEKIFRDCRAAQIEDGENYTLTMRLGLLAGLLYEDGWTKQ